MRELSSEHDPRRAAWRFVDGLQDAYGPAGVLVAVAVDDPPRGYAITLLVDRDGHTVIQGEDLLAADRGAPVHTGGVVGGLIAAGRVQRLIDLDTRDDPLLGLHVPPDGSTLALPVFLDGRPRLWVVLFHPDPARFDDRDVEANLLRANLMSGLLATKALNVELQRALAWIREEVDQIALVQRSLLPRALPDIPGLDIAARWETFDRAGGDYYDFLPWRAGDDEEERWTWIVADASGHGPASAVIVAMLHVMLRMLPAPLGGPAVLLREINRQLFACPTCSNFMTAFAGCYRPGSRELSFALAGHPPPLLRRPDGRVEPLRVDPAVPLGVIDSVLAPLAATRLEPGSVLLVYTDGLVDGPEESLGEEGLARALAEADGCAREILDAVFAAAARGAATRTDDQTAVVVKSLAP